MSSGPRQITKNATVAEMGADGSLIILRQGTNDWICFPGDENRIGGVPMCADPMGLQWIRPVSFRTRHPTYRQRFSSTSALMECTCPTTRWRPYLLLMGARPRSRSRKTSI